MVHSLLVQPYLQRAGLENIPIALADRMGIGPIGQHKEIQFLGIIYVRHRCGEFSNFEVEESSLVIFVHANWEPPNLAATLNIVRVATKFSYHDLKYPSDVCGALVIPYRVSQDGDQGVDFILVVHHNAMQIDLLVNRGDTIAN